MIKDDKKRISVTVPKELHKKLLEDAEYDGRSISNYVLKILKEYYNIQSEE